jgi:D-alanyl-D-alanine carboxypeptidase
MRTEALSWRALMIAAALGALAIPFAASPAHAVPDYEHRLERTLTKLTRAEGGPPGAAATIHRTRGRGEAFIHAGVANVDSLAQWRPNSRMRLASISKAHSAAVALALVDDGTLSLDSTVGSLVPSAPPEWSPATLRQLLGHRSGVPNLTADQGWLDAFVAAPRSKPEPEQLIELMTNTALVFPPGSQYAYSNTENQLVGLMAEAASQRELGDLLEELVISPLRLSRTALPRGYKLPGRHGVAGYDAGDREDLTDCCSMAWLWAAGGVYSTPRELNRFIRGYVGGELFGPEVRRQQLSFPGGGKSEPPGPGAIAAGLAVFRYRTPCGTVFGHTGNTFGFTQFAAATRDGRRAATVSINAQITPEQDERRFTTLKRAYRLAVCAALRSRSASSK